VVSGDLTGYAAVVIGGSKGIGRAIGTAVATAGAEVMLVARGATGVEATTAALRARGLEVVGFAADAAVEAEMDPVVDWASTRWGRIDILVICVGATPFISPISETRPSGFASNMAKNLMPMFNALHAAGPLLERSKAGCVLTIASTGAFLPTPGLAYYGAAKAAVVNLTRTTALEWAPRGIRVNALAPGWVRTEMSAAQRADPAVNDAILESIPMGRWGEPEDIADAALFLCSPAARYITGATLVVDGGLLLTGG
jgi:NAD(P)-dependent dehydrogenase (short-subunit alcohol dehydrogenase family)